MKYSSQIMSPSGMPWGWLWKFIKWSSEPSMFKLSPASRKDASIMLPSHVFFQESSKLLAMSTRSWPISGGMRSQFWNLNQHFLGCKMTYFPPNSFYYPDLWPDEAGIKCSSTTSRTTLIFICFKKIFDSSFLYYSSWNFS